MVRYLGRSRDRGAGLSPARTSSTIKTFAAANSFPQGCSPASLVVQAASL
jgi:hypothetical protein